MSAYVVSFPWQVEDLRPEHHLAARISCHEGLNAPGPEAEQCKDSKCFSNPCDRAWKEQGDP